MWLVVLASVFYSLPTMISFIPPSIRAGDVVISLPVPHRFLRQSIGFITVKMSTHFLILYRPQSSLNAEYAQTGLISSSAFQLMRLSSSPSPLSTSCLCRKLTCVSTGTASTLRTHTTYSCVYFVEFPGFISYGLVSSTRRRLT